MEGTGYDARPGSERLKVRHTLDTNTFAIIGAIASMSVRTQPPPGVPPPPDYLPEMADELIVKNTVKALSPRIVAVHGPTGLGSQRRFH